MPELPDINQLGQAALGLPQAVMTLEAQHLTEKMGAFSTEVEKLGTTMPMALPELPGMGQLALPELPGMPTGTGAAVGEPPAKTVVGKRVVKSYMEI